MITPLSKTQIINKQTDRHKKINVKLKKKNENF